MTTGAGLVKKKRQKKVREPPPKRCSYAIFNRGQNFLCSLEEGHDGGHKIDFDFAGKPPGVSDFICTRCETALRTDSAVAVIIEVMQGSRVIERLQFFDLHRACARTVATPELNKRKKKYRYRPDINIRSDVMRIL